jgi:hypothetical protein
VLPTVWFRNTWSWSAKRTVHRSWPWAMPRRVAHSCR